MTPQKPFRLTAAQYHGMLRDSIGLCRNCHAERECTEPDARHYECEECGERDAFGLEALLEENLIDVEPEPTEIMPPEPKPCAPVYPARLRSLFEPQPLARGKRRTRADTKRDREYLRPRYYTYIGADWVTNGHLCVRLRDAAPADGERLHERAAALLVRQLDTLPHQSKPIATSVDDSARPEYEPGDIYTAEGVECRLSRRYRTALERYTGGREWRIVGKHDPALLFRDAILVAILMPQDY